MTAKSILDQSLKKLEGIKQIQEIKYLEERRIQLINEIHKYYEQINILKRNKIAKKEMEPQTSTEST